MKIAVTLSCALFSPWLLAYSPYSSISLYGDDALCSDNMTEDDSFNGGGGGYDPGSYPGYEEEDENTIETDSAPKTEPSIEGGTKGGSTHPEHEEKADGKIGAEKAPSDSTEDGSFHEKTPIKPKPAVTKKKKEKNGT